MKPRERRIIERAEKLGLVANILHHAAIIHGSCMTYSNAEAYLQGYEDALEAIDRQPQGHEGWKPKVTQ